MEILQIKQVLMDFQMLDFGVFSLVLELEI